MIILYGAGMTFWESMLKAFLNPFSKILRRGQKKIRPIRLAAMKLSSLIWSRQEMALLLRSDLHFRWSARRPNPLFCRCPIRRWVCIFIPSQGPTTRNLFPGNETRTDGYTLRPARTEIARSKIRRCGQSLPFGKGYSPPGLFVYGPVMIGFRNTKIEGKKKLRLLNFCP